MSRSLVEQVGVGPGANQVQFVSLNPVYQEPVGLDVRLTVTFPDSAQGMVEVTSRERFLADQPGQHRPQLG